MSVGYNVLNYSNKNGFLVVVIRGPYMNGIEVVIGNTSSPSTRVAYFGDDINNNTKAASTIIPIRAGNYYIIRPSIVGASGGWGFESIWLTFYPTN